MNNHNVILWYSMAPTMHWWLVLTCREKSSPRCACEAARKRIIWAFPTPYESPRPGVARYLPFANEIRDPISHDVISQGFRLDGRPVFCAVRNPLIVPDVW